MEGVKCAVFLISCSFLLNVTLSASIPASKELIQMLEERVEELTETVKLLKEESSNHAKRQTTTCILNENAMTKRSCKEIHDSDNTAASGIYTITPTDNNGDFTVFCDMTNNGGGWTVIQRRDGNTTNFYRNWQEYKLGFGELDGNFWLGLERIHQITQIENYELLVTMTDHDDATFVAKYNLFKVSSSATRYQLDLGSYIRADSDAGDSLSIHDNQKFSTLDNDNDQSAAVNCAVTYHGAWWYNNCHESNLNGRYYAGDYGNYDGNNPTAYADGIVWYGVTGYWHSLKSVTMAIRPSS